MDTRQQLLQKAAENGKYSALYNYLKSKKRDIWQASFSDIEKILGFSLPDSARIHRPWWANQGVGGGHSHALAWEMAGWKTSQVKLVEETLVFVRDNQA